MEPWLITRLTCRRRRTSRAGSSEPQWSASSIAPRLGLERRPSLRRPGRPRHPPRVLRTRRARTARRAPACPRRRRTPPDGRGIPAARHASDPAAARRRQDSRSGRSRPAAGGLVQDQPQAGGVTEFRDPMKVGDQPLGIAFLRAGEERLQRLAGASACHAGRRGRARSAVPMALEQSREQLRVDGAHELGIDELPEIDGHRNLPDSNAMFLVCSLSATQPEVE